MVAGSQDWKPGGNSRRGRPMGHWGCKPVLGGHRLDSPVQRRMSKDLKG